MLADLKESTASERRVDPSLEATPRLPGREGGEVSGLRPMENTRQDRAGQRRGTGEGSREIHARRGHVGGALYDQRFAGDRDTMRSNNRQNRRNHARSVKPPLVR